MCIFGWNIIIINHVLESVSSFHKSKEIIFQEYENPTFNKKNQNIYCFKYTK